MAERRMFAKTIIDSDAFLDMPLSTQALYFHLSMRADDDGFINNPRKIQRMIGCGDDDLKLLIAKNFILPFDSGVVVIKHWKIHNYIRNDRYKETVYQEEKAMLSEKENKAYTFGIPNDNQVETQYRIGKDSIGEVSIVEDSDCDSCESTPPAKEKVDCQQVVDLFHSLCKSFPRVRALTDARKKAIKARLNTYTLDDFKTVFANAEKSSFLKGGNDRNWTATFDWLIKDGNMAKVLEGNYTDKPKRNGRKEVVPDWCRERDYTEFEKDLKHYRPKFKTAAEDEEIRARAEALQEKLKGD